VVAKPTLARQTLAATATTITSLDLVSQLRPGLR
jgi:hypothetical protein